MNFKLYLLTVLCQVFFLSYSQDVPEKSVNTDVNEVIVFTQNAQVTRKKDLDLQAGEQLIKFTGLSPFIDPKSIQVKAEGELIILSVNHQQNYIDKSEKSLEFSNLENQYLDVEKKIKLEGTYLSIIKEELAFLQENRDIGGKNQDVNINNLKEASNFYSTKLTELKLNEIERNNTLNELNQQKKDIENQLKTLTTKKVYPAGEIWVKTNVKKPIRTSFEISYLVSNAGWFPSYDIRAKNINEPVQLIYKANVRQDTKENWSNVKLKFSSSNPSLSGIAPELKTYYLDYNTFPPVYNQNINTVRGKVVSNQNEPLPGVNVIVQGTTIGTITDMDGNYSITIPNNANSLQYNYIGYISQVKPITSEVINITLDEDVLELEEVVVTGYGVSKKSMLTGAIQGLTPGLKVDKDSEIKIRGAASLAIPLTQVERQTTVEFEIKNPYTIKSENKNYSIDLDVYELPAEFKYYCVPKINNDAFLLAYLIDWEKYNLLEGEANIFFENTYIGKTLLDVRYASDTLKISLGRDKNVVINREKIKDFTSKKTIGAKKEETRAWKITVKNNKNQTVNLTLLDQVPVSTLEEIEVNALDITGAIHNKESGEIKWDLVLAPSEKKELQLKYAVKYPKNRYLIIE